jgi:hypothetical protein
VGVNRHNSIVDVSQLLASIIFKSTAGAKSNMLGVCIVTIGGTEEVMVPTNSQFELKTSHTYISYGGVPFILDIFITDEILFVFL